MGVYEKLNAIQVQLSVPKANTARGAKFSYKYRSAENILAELKPLLKSQACVILMTDDIVEKCGGAYVQSVAKLHDVESGEEVAAQGLARLVDGQPKDQNSAAQVTGSTTSYARKYALCALFAIDGEEDDDELAEKRGWRETQQSQQFVRQAPPQPPVSVPVNAPVNAPVSAPVNAPVNAPVSAPGDPAGVVIYPSDAERKRILVEKARADAQARWDNDKTRTDEYKCQECGAIITAAAYFDTSKGEAVGMTPKDVVDNATAKYKRMLCQECSAKEKRKREGGAQQ